MSISTINNDCSNPALTVQSTPLREIIRQMLVNYFKQLDGAHTAHLYELVMEEVELPLLQIVMKFTEGNQTKAAELLGMSRGTLRKKLEHYKGKV